MRPLALVTGASRGLGRGIALALAPLGYDLLLNYKSNQSAAEATMEDCLERARAAGQNIDCRIRQGDISQASDRVQLMEFARTCATHLSLLVNNAGVAPEVRADILETSEESFDRLMGINVKGPFFLTQLAAKWMVERVQENAQAGYAPKIVTVSSISAYTASTNRAEYCVSKAALSMLTPLYATRLAEFGIKVYEIRPGIMQTDMTARVKDKYDRLISDGLTPIRRWGTPEDVGKAVAAVALDLFPFSTGEVINVDGGFHIHRL